MTEPGGLSRTEIEELAAEAPVPLSAAQKAARARGIERRTLAAMGGGIAAAGLPRCPHGRLRATCPGCDPGGY